MVTILFRKIKNKSMKTRDEVECVVDIFQNTWDHPFFFASCEYIFSNSNLRAKAKSFNQRSASSLFQNTYSYLAFKEMNTIQDITIQAEFIPPLPPTKK